MEISRTQYGLTSSFARRILQGAQGLLGRTPVPAWYASKYQLSGAVVLMYHSVAGHDQARWIDPRNHLAPRVFERHVRYLAQYRTIVSLPDLVKCMVEGQSLARGTVALTFDDGYLDNLEVAFPILEKFGLPATLFLPTTYIDKAEPHWIDQLYFSFRKRTAHRLNIRLRDTEYSWSLDSASQSRAAYSALCAYLLTSDYGDRAVLFEAITEQLSPAGAMPKLTMSWDDVRQAADRFDGIEFGSHTETHLDLTEQPEDVIRRELRESKARIEAVLDRKVRLFAFPYNRTSPIATGMLEALGYDGAVAAGEGIRVEPATPRFSLPRLVAPTAVSQLAFITSGAYPELSVALTGRA